MVSNRSTWRVGVVNLWVCFFLVWSAGVSWGVQPRDGFFTGVELEPIANASIGTVEAEPAVALMFATDQNTADVTRQFNDWYESASRPDVAVYAIAVGPANLSREVVVEAVQQRELKMPVYLTRTDMLLGDSFRVLVLDDDREIDRFTSMDPVALNASLKRAGFSVAAASVPSSTPAPGVTVTTTTTIMTAPAPVATVPTTTGEPMVLGGPGGDRIYSNEDIGLSVEFPPDWEYRVPAKNDGAVAIPPTGSRLDLRVWSVIATAGVSSAEQYVDNTLDALARKYGVRISVERRFQVNADGEDGYDVTYQYVRSLNPANPALGGLLYRGRMQVFLIGDRIKAASAEAPSGEFQAATPTVESFIRSFSTRAAAPPANPSVL